jgi:hypothetical protein
MLNDVLAVCVFIDIDGEALAGAVSGAAVSS